LRDENDSKDHVCWYLKYPVERYCWFLPLYNCLIVQGFGLQEADCGRGLKAIVCSIVVFGLSSLEGDMKNRQMKEIQVAFDGY
jgi:hypothetical protein